ncbi:PqiC family protein [Stutzerimonas zhaodongensis]|uniref:PqiC family protein n=1 Tax=Stutzerimonas TaxID=2901164 RepID=UPI00388DACA7
MQRFTTVLLLACVSLTGCVTQPVPMYRLDNGTLDMPEQTANGAAVLLRPVKLADYLQRDGLLQRLPDGSLSVDGQRARWAGDLQGDINQLLLRQLAWRLKTQSLELSPGSKGFEPDVQIEVEITRLDSGPQHPAVLEAQWRLLDKQGKRQSSRLVRLQEEHQGSATDQVRAQSVLLQRLSEMMSSAVEPMMVAKTRTKQSVSKRPSEPQPAPAIPAADPIRTDLEVFRF